MQTTIRKWGNSAGARLPANILKAVGINVNDTVDIEIVDNSIVLRAGIEHKSVEDLLKMSPSGSFDLSEEDKEWLNAEPVGLEVI
jgi:antitoxin MazE/antitoxin ChpS